MSQEQIFLLPVWYVMFLLSITCHEAAHAAAAWRGGDSTAYLGGQVTLNPLPHLLREPMGAGIVPLVSYLLTGWMMGWASAPYDPRWEDRHPRRAALMAAAGPLANLGLAAIGFAGLKIGLVLDLWTPPVGSMGMDRLVQPLAEGTAGIEGLGRLLSVMLSLNLALFLFNLLPLPPLDGASVAAGLIPAMRTVRDRLRESAFGGLLGLVLAWQAFGWIFAPVYRGVLRWLFN